MIVVLELFCHLRWLIIVIRELIGLKTCHSNGPLFILNSNPIPSSIEELMLDDGQENQSLGEVESEQENKKKTSPLLSLIEARDRWNSSNQGETNLNGVLSQITGKSSQNGLTASQKVSLKEIISRTDREDAEEKEQKGTSNGKARMVKFENLKIFFE